MKADKISESGMITPDGLLRMPMDRLKAFFAEHKGERVIVVFEAAGNKQSKLQMAYYYNYVLPCVVAGMRETGVYMSESKADKWLIEQYPGDLLNDGKHPVFGRELNQTQMSDFLDWLKQYAAENLYVYIEDPRTL